MKKFFTFVLVAMAAMAVHAKEIVMQFDDAAAIQSYGIDLPAAGAGTNLSSIPFEVDGITFSCVKNGSNDTRIWNSSGKYNLRTYTKNTITLTSDGENIAGIDVVGSGTFAELTNGSWVGDAKSVTLTCTSNAQITQITIYTGQAPVVKIDTLNVGEMIALIDAAPNKKLAKKAYVIGRVGGLYAGGISQYGNINVWLGDIRTANATDTIEAYCMLSYDGVKYTDEAEIQFGEGDTIVVYSSSWEYYSDDKNQQYEASKGCYLAEVVGEGHPKPIEYEVINVAQAVEIGTALEDNTSTKDKYAVRGYVVSSYDFDTEHSNQTFYMSDEKTGYGPLCAKYTTGDVVATITKESTVTGDYVEVVGQIEKYNGNIQILRGVCKILSHSDIVPVKVANKAAKYFDGKQVVFEVNGVQYNVLGNIVK